MTVASEITRLQNAKSSIKTSIENKGVTVGSSLKLDGYAACIDAIPTGSSDCFIEALVVGGGGGGGGYNGGGGGAGGVLYDVQAKVLGNPMCVVIGAGGKHCGYGVGCTGGGSTICNICIGGSNLQWACGGGGGGTCSSVPGCPGGSGGGAGFCGSCQYGIGGCPYFHQGNKGGSSIFIRSYLSCSGGGGGGADLSGCDGGNIAGAYSCGGRGCTWTKGYTFDYGGGGGGGGTLNGGGGCGQCGGGSAGSNATSYGGGGGGGGKGNYYGGDGYQGVVIIRRPADGSYGFKTATGGNCCNCANGWCTRMFTSNGTFTITG